MTSAGVPDPTVDEIDVGLAGDGITRPLADCAAIRRGHIEDNLIIEIERPCPILPVNGRDQRATVQTGGACKRHRLRDD